MNNNNGGENCNDAVTAGVITRNIKALVERRRKEEDNKPLGERFADAVTRFSGNMAFVYTHIIIYGAWIIINLGWVDIKPFDESFIGMQIVAQLEGIFLATFVLMSQNSLDAQADKRADLDLQISLLSEHEITKLITMVSAIADKLDIKEASDPEIDELRKDVAPEALMDSLEEEKKTNGMDGLGH